MASEKLTPAGIAEVLREAEAILGGINCHSYSGLGCDSNDAACTICSPPGRIHNCLMVAVAHAESAKVATLAAQLEAMEPVAHHCSLDEYHGVADCGYIHADRGCSGSCHPLYQFQDEKGDRKDGDET